MIGGVTTPQSVASMGLMFTRTSISGSLIGGIANT